MLFEFHSAMVPIHKALTHKSTDYILIFIQIPAVKQESLQEFHENQTVLSSQKTDLKYLYFFP